MRLEAQHLMRAAEAATGFADWGGEEFGEAAFRTMIDALVISLNDEAGITEAGMNGALLRLEAALEARLVFVADRRRRPEISAERIVAPLIITGVPRSGSTFLHTLLARDPANKAPSPYEMTFPLPADEANAESDAQRIERVRRVYDAMGLFAPNVQDLHPFDPVEPEEDHLAQEILLLGENWFTTWRIPSYLKARATLPAGLGWTVHKQVMQTLQVGMPAERLLLKHPGHIFDPAGLLATYPDALIVQTHRDPAKVLPSVAALICAMREHMAHAVPDRAKVARGNLTAFARGLEALIEFRADPAKDRLFLDVQFLDLIRDPMATVDRIYDAFGLRLSDTARAAMVAWLADPASKSPKGRHLLADYGLDRDEIDTAFANYVRRFDVPLERG